MTVTVCQTLSFGRLGTLTVTSSSLTCRSCATCAHRGSPLTSPNPSTARQRRLTRPACNALPFILLFSRPRLLTGNVAAFKMGRKKTDWASRAGQSKDAESSAWASFSKRAEPMSSVSLLEALSEIKTSKRTKVVGVSKKPKVNKKLLRLKRRKEELVRKASDR